MTQSNRPVVLVIDPDPLTLTGLTATLHHESLEVHGARTRTAAFRAAQDLALDLIVVDSWVEPDHGLSLIQAIRLLPHLIDVPVVFLVEQEQAQSLPFPTSSFQIQKPIDLESLVAVVKRAVWMPHLIHSPSTPQPHTFPNRAIGTSIPSSQAQQI